VRRLGRYVSAEETRLFVQDYLLAEHPEAALRPRREGPRGRDAGEGCQWLQLTPALRDLVRGAVPLNDPKMLAFLARAGGGHLRVTFDSAVALNDPAVEHLHALHPLVRAIVKIYEDHPDRIPPVACVEVATDVVPDSDYFFLWAEIDERGLQAGKSLWATCV